MNLVQTNLDGEVVKIINVTGDAKNTSIAYIDSSNNFKVKIKPVDWTLQQSLSTQTETFATDQKISYKWQTGERTNPFGTSADFPKFDIAWRQFTSGIDVPTIAFIGASTTQGVGGSYYSIAYPNRNSYPRFFMDRLKQDYGILTGEFMLPPTSVNNNDCWKLGVGWTKAGLGLGKGSSIECPVGVTTTTTWSDIDCVCEWDRAEIIGIQTVNGGPYILSATGGAQSSGTCYRSNGYDYVKYTVSAGSRSKYNKVYITPTTSASHLWIVGIHVYDSTAQRLTIANCGVGGSTSTDWTTNNSGGFLPTNMLNTTLNCKLCFVSLGINEYAGATSAYKNNIQTLVNSLRSFSDVILLSPNYVGNDNPAVNPKLQEFEQALYSVSGVAKYVPMWTLMQDYNIPFWDGSDWHPTITGYKIISDILYKELVL